MMMVVLIVEGVGYQQDQCWLYVFVVVLYDVFGDLMYQYDIGMQVFVDDVVDCLYIFGDQGVKSIELYRKRFGVVNCGKCEILGGVWLGVKLGCCMGGLL